MAVGAVVGLALAGCASPDPYAHAPIAAHLQRDDPIGDCARLFQRIDRAVDAAGVRDAQAPRVRGFPYLRVDRLTASLAPAAERGAADAPARPGTQAPADAAVAESLVAEAHDADAHDAEARQRLWRDRLAALDRQARAIEIGNAGGAAGDHAAHASLERCRDRLAAADRSSAGLASVARVDDDYSSVLRTLGLYPLTRLAFAAGVSHWHAEVRARHALPLDRLPRQGSALRYAPASAMSPGPAVPAPLPADALGVPRVSPALAEALLARHAPVLEIDTVDADDRLGRLGWGDGGRRIVADTAQPVAYTRLTYTQLAGALVPQLVYTFWFPARPPQGLFDPLAGHLDGLVWRITLSSDLRPLVSDSIHACGCYHQFFPTPRVRDRTGPLLGEGAFDETRFVPQRVEVPREGERQLLTISARSHQVLRVGVIAAAAADDVRYTLRDDDELRALPWPAASAPRGTRSAFGPDGLLAGTERLERLFFWPMGIPSAGQMRQWGRHATAFVGRRHFDDPTLIDRYFDVLPAWRAGDDQR